MTGTPSGTRLTSAALRATNGINHSAASKVFSHGLKPRPIPSTAIMATAGASTIIVVIEAAGRGGRRGGADGHDQKQKAGGRGDQQRCGDETGALAREPIAAP